MTGWLLLITLTFLAAFAALAAVTRAAFEGRAARFVAFTAALFALIAAPVLALGHLRALRPATLAIVSAALSAGTIAAASKGVGLRVHGRATARNAVELARLPWDALRLTVAARSLSAMGLLAAMAWIGWTAVLSYYAPSESWDGFFYHEPMVGLALQNHGFATVDLPRTLVSQPVNGFPRLCESVALWFCIFTDRRLIEIGNSIAAPGLMVATYLLAKGRSRDAAACVGWGAAMLWMPAVYSQLRTSMIDAQVGFFLVAALHFATRPRVGRREALFGTLCLLLLLASKGTALAWAPPIAIALFFRLYTQTERASRRAVLGTAAVAAVAMAGVAALTLVPNYLAFHNPIWPVEQKIPALGVAWKGLVTMDKLGVVMSLRELAAMKYHAPVGDVSDIIARDYGVGFPWIVVPSSLLCAAAIVVRAARGRLGKKPDRAAESALWLVGSFAFFSGMPPGLTIARFNIGLIALAMAVVAAGVDGLDKGARLHEGVVSSTLALSLVAWSWTGFLGGLEMTPQGIARLLRAPAADRAWMNSASFQMPQETARRREEELGPGDLAVFTQDEAFFGVLWNDRFDNRVEYVPFERAESFLAELDRRCAKWVVVGKSGPARAAVDSHPGAWQLVGPAVRQSGTVALRRLTPCPAAGDVQP